MTKIKFLIKLFTFKYATHHENEASDHRAKTVLIRQQIVIMKTIM